MVLNYAGITFEKIWDPEVATKALKKYDWLHLHHEDFTGQYSKFFLNYSGAPWLTDMVQRNQGTAKALGFLNVPAEKRAVAQEIRAFVDRGGFLFAMCTAPRRSTWRWPVPIPISPRPMPTGRQWRPTRRATWTGARRLPSRMLSWN
jgi:hypothetical protein